MAEKSSTQVKDVCDLVDDRRIDLTLSEWAQHKGPYPHYSDDCSRQYVDDYTFEAGGTVMVSAMGQVVSGATGRLICALETGRCSAGKHAHALVPHDPKDAAYLWRALSTSPTAANYVMGSPQLRDLSGPSLLAMRIPWPDAATRRSYVLAQDELDQRRATLTAHLADLYARGDAAFAQTLGASQAPAVPLGQAAQVRRGTNVNIKLRGPDKPVRIEAPSGVIGRCDEALTQGESLVVGPSALHLVAHLVDEPCHPLEEVAFVEGGGDLPLPVLLFALRHAGVGDTSAEGRKQAALIRLDDLPQLPLSLGTAEERRQVLPQLRSVASQLEEAQRALDRERELRVSLVKWFFALEDGAAPAIDPLSYVQLDRLVPAVEALPGDLGAADAAWELAPIAALRALLTAEGWAPIAQAAQGDASGLVAALDGGLDALAAQDDLLSFLPNLSYTSSLLSAGQLAAVVRALGEVPPSCITASEVRALFARGDRAGQAPAAVAAIMARLAAATCPDPVSAYVPSEDAGTACDLLAQLAPEATVRAQFGEFSQILSAALVRAVAGAAAGELRGGLGAAASSALLDDEFGDWEADLVLALPPCNQENWAQSKLEEADPRWVLGVPPRTKANFAWLETALSHQAKGGATVLLISNRVLTSTVGSEPSLRRKLIEQERVRCVVALPAGIFADGRQASSVLVLGDEGSAAETLFVNAIGRGTDAGAGTDDAPEPRRYLDHAETERVLGACIPWLAGQARPDEAGFARVLSAGDILTRGGSLAPWEYA